MALQTTHNFRKRQDTSPSSNKLSSRSQFCASPASTQVLLDNATKTVFTRLADILAERIPAEAPLPATPSD